MLSLDGRLQRRDSLTEFRDGARLLLDDARLLLDELLEILAADLPIKIPSPPMSSFLPAVNAYYFHTDSWLWNPLNKRRKSQAKYVDGLYRYVVFVLCRKFNIEGTPSNLKVFIEDWWGHVKGKSLEIDKLKADLENPNVLLPDDELMKRRIVFRHGRAHMWTWYQTPEAGETYRLVPANSNHASNIMIQPGFAGYALRVDGQLFMAHHREAHEEGGKFAHSAYTNGDRVLCAGEIAIVNGTVTCVSTASGHYAPGARNMMQMLRFLQREGVNLGPVLVGVYVSDEQQGNDFIFYDALPFMARNGNLSRLAASERKRQVFAAIPGYIEGMVEKTNRLNAPFREPGDRLTTAEDIWQLFR